MQGEGQAEVSPTTNLRGTWFSDLDKSCEETQTLVLSLLQNRFCDLQNLSTEAPLEKGGWVRYVGFLQMHGEDGNSANRDATENIHAVVKDLK